MRCPRCGVDLEGWRTEHGLAFRCASCAGEALSMAVVRKRVAQPAANAIWRGARGARGGQGDAAEGLACPTCAQPMASVTLGDAPGAGALTLDGCERCAVVWFDAAEADRLAPRPGERVVAPRWTAEQAEASVAMKVAAAHAQGAFEPPVHPADAVLDPGASRLRSWLNATPWLSFGLGILLLSIHLVALFVPLGASGPGRVEGSARLADDYAFDPAQPLRRGGLTLITSFLVAPQTRRGSGLGGILLLFLTGWLLEARLGRVRFLGLLALGHGAALGAYAAAGMPRGAGLLGPSAGVFAALGWACVILGRAYMNERRLRGRWWEAWHGVGGGQVRPLLALGFLICFGWAALACLGTPWEDLVFRWHERAGQADTLPAAFVGGLLGLALGLVTLRRVGNGPAAATEAGRERR